MAFDLAKLGAYPNLKTTHDPTNELMVDPSAVIGKQINGLMSSLEDFAELIKQIIAEAITGIFGADVSKLAEFFANLQEFLGDTDFNAPGGFNAQQAVLDFVQNVLVPTGLLGGAGASWDELYLALSGNPAPADALAAIAQFFNTNFTNIADELATKLDPNSNLDATKLVGLVASLIPNLDAAKITTGIFGTGQIPALAQSKITGLVTDLASKLDPTSPLDATKLVGLVASLIPNLDAGKITSGTFGTGQIPALPQSQITGLVTALAGKLDPTSSLDASKLTALLAAQIPNLDGSKITTGTVAAARIATLAQSQITNLVTDLASKLDPTSNLDGSKITTGTVAAARIANLAQSQVTGLEAALAAAVGQIISQVPAQWLPQIPLSSLTTMNPNLLWNGGFNDPISINAAATDFTHDATVGRTTPLGSAKIVFNGTERRPLWSNSIPAVAGDTFTLTGRVTWSAVTSSGGNALELYAVAYNSSDAVISETLLNGTASSGTQAAWQTVSANYTAPANTAYIAMGWKGRSRGTAGSAWVDDCEVLKSSLGSLDLAAKIANLTTGGLFDSSKLTNILNIPQIAATRILGFEGDVDTMLKNQLTSIAAILQGLDPTDVTSPNLAAGQAGLKNVWDLLTDQAAAIRALQTPTTGAAISINFANYATAPLPAGEFSTTYVGAGSSVVGVSDGAVRFTTLTNDGNRKAQIRYTVDRPTGDNVSLRATLKDLPSGSSGTSGTPRIWGIARMSADWLNFVYIRGYTTGFLAYKCDIGCYVNGVEYPWQNGISLKLNTSITLNYGVGGNPRRYQGYSGNSLIIDYTESGGTLSLLPSAQATPANYRNIGMIIEMTSGSGGARSPGSLAGFSSVNT